METEKKSTAKYWIYFIVWTVIMAAMLYNPDWRPFFWLALPGVVTSFSKGMDIF